MNLFLGNVAFRLELSSLGGTAAPRSAEERQSTDANWDRSRIKPSRAGPLKRPTQPVA